MTKCAFIPNFFRFYNILWRAVLPFLRRNKRLAPTFAERVSPHLAGADIWLQAASAGEAFLALSILSKLEPSAPVKVLITTTTDQGEEVLRQGLGERCLHTNITVAAALFPFDLPAAVNQAIAQVNPQVMVLLETELWPGFLHALKQRGIPVLVLNARMSRRSGSRYKKTRWLWQCLAPDRILAISEPDRRRYEKVFPDTPAGVMTNIKFDILESESRGAERADPELAGLFTDTLPVSILASFRRQEEKKVLTLIKELKSRVPDQIVALFPRHMHRIPALKKQLRKHRIPFTTRSGLEGPVTGPGVILWDKFGELRQAYPFARAVFVGGSLAPLGGQNFIEPAVLGIPTVIGPHWEDFSWVGQGIFDLGVVSAVPDVSTAATAMEGALKTSPDIPENRAKIRTYLSSLKGGSHRAARAILDAISAG